MNTSHFIANRLREVYLNGSWIANTNYKQQLERVDVKKAICEIQGFNSIAKLTFHINYYLKGLLDAFRYGRIEISDKYSFNLPELKSEEAWQDLVKDLLFNANEFADMVANLPEADWHKPFIDSNYGTLIRNIEGVIEHSYYHLGQLVLISKLYDFE